MSDAYHRFTQSTSAPTTTSEAIRSGSTEALWAERFSEESTRLEQKLREAGVNPGSLMQTWGVRVWSVRAKGDKIRLKLEACGAVDEDAITQWFQAIFGNEKPVSIKISPVSKCCLSPCDGCLMGNPSKRAHWLNTFGTCNEIANSGNHQQPGNTNGIAVHTP